MTGKEGASHKDQGVAQLSFKRTEQVRLLYMQALVSNSVIILISILYYFLLRSHLHSSLLLIWLVLLLIISSYRLFLWHSQARRPKSRPTEFWLSRYLIACGLLGTVWSLIYPFLINSNDPLVFASLLILAFGVMSSAVPILSACVPAFILYTYPQGIVLVATLVWMEDSNYSWLALAVGIYLLMLTLFSRNTHKSIFKSINLQQQNHSLIDDLNIEINQRETLITKRTSELKKKNEELIHEMKERQNAEEELRSSERKYRELINSSPDLRYRTDSSGKIVFVSPSVKKISGYSVEDLTGQRMDGFYVNPEERENVLALLQKNGFVTDYESQLKRKDGSVWWASTNAQIFKNSDGEVIGVEGVTRDVTARRQAEEEKSILEAQLHQAQKLESIGTLAGGVAHEFNNMLAIILGNNQLLMEELSHESLVRESTEEIRIEGIRARDVVKQLLTFSRQDDVVTKVLDFKSVVEESIKLIRSTTPVNVKIEQHVSVGPCLVLGNDTQINQLLINLCNNGVDALPEQGGVITITLLNETISQQHVTHPAKMEAGEYVKLMVSDNGVGMKSEILDRIFEPYYTTKNIGEGTGIGLAIVHGIVERHGGTIMADSKPGHGTTYTIFLPVYDGPLVKVTGRQNELPVGEESILYVDDEESIVRIGKRLLEKLGYTVEASTNPEEALKLVRNDPNRFDLLITDMAMPSMTGDQLIVETLKIRADLPTIICTGYSATVSKKDAANIGARSYIMKPIKKSELATTVRTVLDEAKVIVK